MGPSMGDTIQATYDGRVLIPSHPLSLQEGEQVNLLVLVDGSRSDDASGSERARRIREWGASAPRVDATADDDRASIYEPVRGS